MQSLVNKGDRYPSDDRPITDPVIRFYLYDDISGYNRTVVPAGFTMRIEYSYNKGNGTAKSGRVIDMSGRNYIEIPLSELTATDSDVSNWSINLVADQNYTQIDWGRITR
ncbi:hypothetical protein [Sphingobacterium thalpophilum]|uniref:hypothetical protein n=1 Tax=Sphingobacterium thalpophilum TaxID=259 RepID=UPI003C71BFC7